MYAEEFVRLSFRLNKHIPGLVDSYFGPEELKREVEGDDVMPLPALREKCRELAEMVRGDCHHAPDPDLCFYREKHVDALAAQIDRLLGRASDYYEYVHRLFDIDLEPVHEGVIDEHHGRIALLLGRLGYHGKPEDALLSWERGNEVGADELADVVNSVCRQAREMTRKIIALPRGERVTVETVRNQPWSGYNWYQGRYRSLIQVNLDLPRTRFEAEDLAHHEAYPGHHTDHSCKEKALYRERGLLETSVMLINTPTSVLSEGIASVAGRFIAPPELDDARLLAGTLRHLRRACDANATIQLHAEGASEATVAAYLEEWGMMTRQRATKRMEFLTNPLWSSYSFTYWFGSRIIDEAFDRAKAAGTTGELLRLLYTGLLTPATLEESLRSPC